MLYDMVYARLSTDLAMQGWTLTLGNLLSKLTPALSHRCQLSLRKARLSRARHPLPRRCCATCSRCRAEPPGSHQR